MDIRMKIPPAKTKPRSQEVAFCRHCYDHLAGKIGVAITEALIENGIIESGENEFKITPQGKIWFAEKGIDVEAECGRKRLFAKKCIDWTERKPHLGGAMGAALLRFLVDSKWIEARADSRAMTVTEKGRLDLNHELNIDLL